MHLIVVGGGPVGLFAATTAAQQGMAVTLFESRAGDGDKACGEGLMPPAVRALESIGVQPTGRSFTGIRYLDASGRTQVRADVPNAPGLGVRRTELVRELRRAASEAGVKCESSRVVAVSSTDESADIGTGGRASVVTQEGDVWDADVLLGCDGLSSTVRESVGLEQRASGPRRYGLVAHYAVAPWSSDVEVYWGAHGEAYVTPVGDDLVGVALLGGRGSSFEQRLEALPGLRSRLGGATEVGQVRGAGPLRRSSTAPRKGRVLLVGDAAGYVDALTGEGLAVGFLSARAAVAAAAGGSLDTYPDAWRSITRRSRWSTEALVRATSVSSVRRALLPVAATAPRVFEKAVSWCV